MTPLAEQLIDALHKGQILDGPMRNLVVETKARAAGCWRLRDEHLELLGFGVAFDMDDEVDRGFREATRRVPLDQLGLGIVKAAVTGQPAIGQREPADNSLDGSATWIAKFQAQTSLAVPIRSPNSNDIIGVLAVSTGDIVHAQHPLWSHLTELADQLGDVNFTGARHMSNQTPGTANDQKRRQRNTGVPYAVR